MPKFDVLIVDDLSDKVLVKFRGLSKKRCLWIKNQWLRRRVSGTSVFVARRERMLPPVERYPRHV
jgi:hypothetical protein